MRKNQITFSIAMAILILFTIVTETFFVKLDLAIIANFSIVADIIFLILSLICLLDSDIFRYIQAFLFVAMGYLSFYLDSPYTFWGWGLIIVGIMISQYYGFWKTNTKAKFFILTISFFIIVILNGIRNHNLLNILTNTLIYTIFLGFFIFKIYDLKVKEFLELKQDYNKLLNDIVEKQNHIEDLQTQLEESNNKQLYEEINKVRKILSYDKEELKAKLIQIEHISELTPLDIDLILEFYISKGNKTNQELAFLLNKNETQIKNRFRTIYQKIPNVTCRSALLSYISEQLDLVP